LRCLVCTPGKARRPLRAWWHNPGKKWDPDPRALACYGVLWQQGPASDPIRTQMSLRFVTGRPVSEITTQFLDWCCTQLQAQGKTIWLLIWDNASWHYSKQVRTWIREHNQQVKREGKGVRILPFPIRFPGASGLYTHAIGKLLHVCSKQKLSLSMIGSTGKGVSLCGLTHQGFRECRRFLQGGNLSCHQQLCIA
jgi:hypothetical protein